MISAIGPESLRSFINISDNVRGKVPSIMVKHKDSILETVRYATREFLGKLPKRLRRGMGAIAVVATCLAGCSAEGYDPNKDVTPDTTATATQEAPTTTATPPSPADYYPTDATEPPSPRKTLDNYLRESAITGVDKAAEKLRNDADAVDTLVELAKSFCDYPSAIETDETSSRSVIVPQQRAADLTKQASCMAATLTAVKNSNNRYNTASAEDADLVFETGVETFVAKQYQSDFISNVKNFDRATSPEVIAVSEEAPLATPGKAVAYSSSRATTPESRSSMTVEQNRNLVGWKDYNFEGISAHICVVENRTIYDLTTGNLKSGEEAYTKLTCVSPENFTGDKGGDLGAENGYKISQDESNSYSCVTIDDKRVKIDGAGETIGTCE